MTTPRNSMSGAFPAGPIAMQPVQKLIPRRVPSVVGATQSFFMRESKALGVSQLPSIPHPRDSLAYRSRCFRPGTQFNPTGRYLTPPEVIFMSDTGGRIRDVQRDYQGDLMPPLDLEACTVRGLPSQVIASIPHIPALEMPQVVGKTNRNKTKVLAPSPLALDILHSPIQVRNQGFRPHLHFLT